MTKNVEPNYHVILIAPAGSLESEKEFSLTIPTITQTSTLLSLAISRQGLDPELDWQLFDELYPNDPIDPIVNPYLFVYEINKGTGRGVFEFRIKVNI